MTKENMLKSVTEKELNEGHYDKWFVAGLSDFIRCDNLSPMVDDTFYTNGKIDKCLGVVNQYIDKLGLKGISHEVVKEPCGHDSSLMTYLAIWVIEPSSSDITTNVMLYGHLDKQPWGDGWETSPIDPVIKGDRLYGRGSSDDGYSVFACMSALHLIQKQGLSHPRIVFVAEIEEESGSPNLLPLLKSPRAKELIQTPDYMFCMDSGALDYENFWLTSTLRGITVVDVSVTVANQNYHSGKSYTVISTTLLQL